MTSQQPAYLEGHPLERHRHQERHGHHVVTAAQRQVMIAEAAYFIAQCRGFAPGHEVDDWLQAEREIERLLFELSRLPERP